MRPRTRDLLPLPSSTPALEAEAARLERELGRLPSGAARRHLALERRRVVIRLDALRRGWA